MGLNKLNQYISEVAAVNEAPGLSIAIIKDNQVVFEEVYGVKNIDTQEPLVKHSVFHAASISKTLTATAVMQLVERGQIYLGQKVLDLLHHIPVQDERAREITVFQMLTHISGWPDVMDYEWDKPQTGESALKDYMSNLKDQELLFDPGERFSYSNTTYDMLGHLVAEISGQTFEQFVDENIFTPLGMEESSFIHSEIKPELRVSPHVRLVDFLVAEHYPYNRRHAPSSTFNTNAAELAKWGIANLNRGELNGNRVLQESTYEQLWKPYMLAKENVEIGLSWFLHTLNGKKVVAHSGSDTGFVSYLLLVPDEGLGVCLLVNGVPFPTEELCFQLLEGLTTGEYREVKGDFLPLVLKNMSINGADAAFAYYQELAAAHKETLNFNPRSVISYAYNLLQLAPSEKYIEALWLAFRIFKAQGGEVEALARYLKQSGYTEEQIKTILP